MRRSTTSAVLALALVLLPSCGSDRRGRKPFRAFNTLATASGMRDPVVAGNRLAYFTSEALTGPGGMDLNGDGDMVDEVVGTLRTDKSGSEELLGVAAEEVILIGSRLFLHVDEAADGRDWNGAGGMVDHVLLTRSDLGIEFVDTLDPRLTGPAFVEVGGRLVYAAEAPVLTGDETSLRRVTSGNPTTPVVVENTLGGGTLRPVLMDEVEELLFAYVDEAVEGGDRNLDGDALDGFVLVLLDGDNRDARVKSTELALADAGTPFDAQRQSNSNWVVAFLVDEAAQGGTNLNDPALFANPTVPVSCAGTPDLDSTDQVLFGLEFAPFEAGNALPLNTGLAGTGRALAFEDFVATLSDEVEAGCDLNEDGDTSDFVVRWSGLVDPVAPPVDPALMVAVETGIPGGAMGMADLFERLVAVVSELQDGADHDGDPTDHDLVAWLDPSDANPTWTFMHQEERIAIGTSVFTDVDGDGRGDPEDGVSIPFASVGWMAPSERFGRLGVTFLESLPGENPMVPSLNINLDCGVALKDMDLVDQLPIWLDFERRTLDFDGVGFALESSCPDLEFAGFGTYFRVSEIEDNVDHNQDGVLDDVVLFHNPFGGCAPRMISSASLVPGLPVFTDGSRAAAFYEDEAMEGEDLNGDGDALDLVVRYFEF